jgi:SAM-dependent methyltransferase
LMICTVTKTYIMHPIYTDIYAGLPKAAPGDDVYTVHAWTRLRDLPEQPELLDLGCGPGRQTLALASATAARITAVDMYAPFIERLGYEMHLRNLEKQITIMQADMNSLPFRPGSFDVIWSEGAIYNMGFDNGLSSLKPLLRDGGWLVVTELCWLDGASRPDEATKFWASEYPGIRNNDDNKHAIGRAGYELTGSLVLPEDAWWEGHYTPMEAKISTLKQQYSGDTEAMQILEMYRREIKLFRNHSSAYGYVFYIMRKP